MRARTANQQSQHIAVILFQWRAAALVVDLVLAGADQKMDD